MIFVDRFDIATSGFSDNRSTRKLVLHELLYLDGACLTLLHKP